MNWLKQTAQPASESFRLSAIERQLTLTKPPGALGKLESIAIHLASLQHTITPQANQIAISIFAADHGIAEENVSAFPQSVTAEMIRNFADGGAAIAVLAKQLDARLRVCNLGTASALEPIDGVECQRLGSGTRNFSQNEAMTKSQLEQALNIGKQHADEALKNHADLFIGGEMGIANTTSASAVASALLQEPSSNLVGPGTGVNQQGIARKQTVIDQALARHNIDSTTSPLECLRILGGFEIAALVGAFIRCAQIGVPVLVDGFIASVAALTSLRINPSIKPWLIATHESAEPGHSAILTALNHQAILQLDMRLGEASGSACAVPLIRLACALHNEMATFESANVSEASP